MLLFVDRYDAGKRLASALMQFKNTDAVIMAIPRGGVVVGYEVAKALNLEMDLVIPKKIRAEGSNETAIGAVMEDGSYYIDELAVAQTHSRRDYIENEIKEEMQEVKRREELYLDGRKRVDVFGRDVIIVDDGIASGYDMIAAERFIRGKNPTRIIIAVPVAPSKAVGKLNIDVDNIICLMNSDMFSSISELYLDFTPVEDEEVLSLLNELWNRKWETHNAKPR